MIGFPPAARSLFQPSAAYKREILCFRFELHENNSWKGIAAPLTPPPFPGDESRGPAFPPRVVRGVLPLLQSLLPDVISEMAALLTVLRGVSSSSSLVINFPVAWTARIHSPVPSSPGGGGRQATITVQTQGCWPGGTRSRIVRWEHCSFPWGSCSRGPGRSGVWAWGTGSRWALCSG